MFEKIDKVILYYCVEKNISMNESHVCETKQIYPLPYFP